MRFTNEELSGKGVDELTALLRDKRVKKEERIITPKALRIEIPASENALLTSYNTRWDINYILSGKDPRMILFVGPCSVHDTDAAIEYAHMLKEIKEEVKDQFLVVMRAYIEKPRTVDGWKGILIDPQMDGTEDVNLGLRKSRRLFRDILELGLGTTTEILNAVTVTYYDEFLTSGSIGARNIESQISRELASGLSIPMGLKNNTAGDYNVAIDAILSASNSHSFIGVDDDGFVTKILTKGSEELAVILRGGNGEPNYKASVVEKVQAALRARHQSPNLYIDCSHGNSEIVAGTPLKKQKDYRLQPEILLDVITQRAKGNTGIVGVMLESYIEEGAQSIPKQLTPEWRATAQLNPRKSCTDACIGIEATKEAVYRAADILRRN